MRREQVGQREEDDQYWARITQADARPLWPPSRPQLLLIAANTLFFAAQFLPNHLTWLYHSPYHALYVFAFLLIVVGLLVQTLIKGLQSLFHRHPTTRRNALRPVITASTILAIGFGLTVANWTSFGGLPGGSWSLPFDSETWKNSQANDNNYDDITPRQKMLGDVVRRIVIGHTRSEIITQLGPSEDVGYFREAGHDLIYCTGPQRSFFPIDSEWLLIWCDNQGKAVKWEVWTD